LKHFFILLFILLNTYSCGNKSSPSNSPTGEVVVVDNLENFKIKRLNGREAWDSNVSKNLYLDLSKIEVSELFDVNINQANLNELGCPRFNEFSIEEKKLFFIVFLAAIAERESDFNPSEITLKNIGLLQIDKSSAVRHAKEYVSPDISDEDLKVSSENLRIGTFILRNQLKGLWSSKVAGKLLTGGNYYWEVLNDQYKHRVIKSFINNRTNLPFCN